MGCLLLNGLEINSLGSRLLSAHCLFPLPASRDRVSETGGEGNQVHNNFALIDYSSAERGKPGSVQHWCCYLFSLLEGVICEINELYFMGVSNEPCIRYVSYIVFLETVPMTKVIKDKFIFCLHI